MHYINRIKSISIFFKMYKKKNELKIKTTTKQQNNKTTKQQNNKTTKQTLEENVGLLASRCFSIIFISFSEGI